MDDLRHHKYKNKQLKNKTLILETIMRGSDSILNSVQLLYCKCHKINFKRGGSYIDSPDWIKKKKAAINPKNEDYKLFQYAPTVALNHEEIKRRLQRISKIKPFINKCNWNGIKYPSKIHDWKTFEKNNRKKYNRKKYTLLIFQNIRRFLLFNLSLFF